MAYLALKAAALNRHKAVLFDNSCSTVNKAKMTRAQYSTDGAEILKTAI
jgi:hypothetical protein